MTSLAFIIGTLITGLCLVAAAFIISGAITGAAAASKESAPQSLQQPTLSFLTEFDAADYLGVSLNELDFMRGEGMLDNTFVAVTSMEQTGEEEYYAMEDGVEVIKVRPVMSPVTRFLFNRQLLDERMLELIKQGQHVNPTRPKSAGKPKGKNDNHKGGKNGQKNSNRPERRDGEQKNERRDNENPGQNKKQSDRPENSGKKPERTDRPERRDNNNNNTRNDDNRSKKPADRSETAEKKPADAPVKTTKPSVIDDDDEIFAKPARASSVDDDFFGGDSKASITLEDDDAFDLDVFGRGDVPTSPSSKFDRKRND